MNKRKQRTRGYEGVSISLIRRDAHKKAGPRTGILAVNVVYKTVASGWAALWTGLPTG